MTEEIPGDYDSKCSEFWQYAREKLRMQRIIHKLYYDSLTEEADDLLKFVKEDNENCFDLISELLDSRGASLEVTEDKIAVAESRAWIGMIEGGDPASSVATRGQFLEEAI